MSGTRTFVGRATAFAVAAGAALSLAGGPPVSEAPQGGDIADGRVARADAASADPDAAFVPSPGTTLDDHGYAIAVGDFNNDDFDDWAIGYPAANEVHLYFGGVHEPFVAPAENEMPVVAEPVNGAALPPVVVSGTIGLFGAALSAGNADGLAGDDLAIGAPRVNTRETDANTPGQAYVLVNISALAAGFFAGSPGSVSCPSTDCIELPRDLTNRRDGDQFGWSVAVSSGRILVGAPRWYDTDPNLRSGYLELFTFGAPVRTATASQLRLITKRIGRHTYTVTRADREGGGGSGIGGGLPSLTAQVGGATLTLTDGDLGEQLGESIAVCDFGAGPQFAVGAPGADVVRFFSSDGLPLPSALLDPELGGDELADDRPQGLFGSALVCADLNADADDEIAVGAVIRDWDQSNYPAGVVGANAPDSPRSNGGAVFIFDDEASAAPSLELLPQSTGEFLGYSLAAGYVSESFDAYEALVVGASRYDLIGDVTANPTAGESSCPLEFVNGAAFVLDLASPPAASLVLSDINVAAQAGMLVRYQVFGRRCGQAGGAVAIGDTNFDRWAEVLTSTNVDPNETIPGAGAGTTVLRPDDPLGATWLFSLNDTDGSGAANVGDADDDGDCFADAWEDRDLDGIRDVDETNPYLPNVNTLLSDLTLSCAAPCEPGDALTVDFDVARSCLAIGAGNSVRVSLALENAGAPVKGDLTFVSAGQGGVVDDSDPNAERVLWTLTDASFPSTAPVALDANLTIDSPVAAAFPTSLIANVEVQLLDAGMTVIREARGVFSGQRVGACDDNRSFPAAGFVRADLCNPNRPLVEQAIVAAATPQVTIAATNPAPYCEFGGSAIACLPNATLPLTLDLGNAGNRNLPAALEARVSLDPAATRCPGDVVGNCFPDQSECQGPAFNGSNATCTLANEVPGQPGNPPVSVPVDLEIRSDASATVVTPIGMLTSTPVAGGTVSPDIPLALPSISVVGDASCGGGGCLPGRPLTFTVTVGNAGAATTDGTVIFPEPAGTTCTGTCVSGQNDAGENISCVATTFGGADAIECDISGLPTLGGTVDFDVDLTIDDPTAVTTVDANATAYFPPCDGDACPGASLFTDTDNDSVPLAIPALSFSSTCRFNEPDPAAAVAVCAAGQRLDYDISLANSGDAATGPAEIVVDLPANTTTFAAPPAGCTIDTVPDPDRMTCSVADVAAGGSADFTLQLQIDDPAPLALRTLDATADAFVPNVGASIFSTDAIADQTVLGFRIETLGCQPNDPLCAIGDTIEFDLLLENVDTAGTGPGGIAVPVPADASCAADCSINEVGLTCVDGAAEILCTIIDVPAASTASVRIVLDIDGSASGQNVPLAANLQLPIGNDIATITNSVDVEPAPGLSIDDVVIAEGDAGTTQALFTVTLSQMVPQQVTVGYTTVAGTATEGDDYTLTQGQLNFSPNDTEETIAVPIVGDLLDEIDEMLTVVLSMPNGALIADDTGELTITDDDVEPTLSIDDVVVAEGDAGTTDAVFTVSLSAPSGQDVSFDWATLDGTATVADNDYVAGAAAGATIPAGAMSTTITVVVNGDTTFEMDESFTVDLNTAVNATFTDTQGLGTITNDDTVPALSIDDVAIAEGDAGTTGAIFTVSLSAPSAVDVSFDWATADGTATVADNDYVTDGATGATISAGTTFTTVTVTVNADTDFESDESFFVDLTNPSNATIADAQGQGTISNDDAAPTLSIDDVVVAEGDAGTVDATFTVTLSQAIGLDVSFDWATADGTATVADNDYVSAGANGVTILAGATSAMLTVTLNGDTTFETDEAFVVDLTNPSNATIADAQGQGTITNDDAMPTISIDDVVVAEGLLATTVDAIFTVSLSAASGVETTFDWATNDGTATLADNDYVANGATGQTIPAGSTSVMLTVTVNGDINVEGDEDFTVDLSAVVGAMAGDLSGTCTITNDD